MSNTRDMIRLLNDALTLRACYRSVFGTADGRRVLADLCKAADIHRSFFSAKDQRKTDYDHGAHDLVLGILTKISRNDEDLRKQIEELRAQENHE